MSDSQAEMGVAKPKGMGRIERDHRVAMEKWLGAERVYTVIVDTIWVSAAVFPSLLPGALWACGLCAE